MRVRRQVRVPLRRGVVLMPQQGPQALTHKPDGSEEDEPMAEMFDPGYAEKPTDRAHGQQFVTGAWQRTGRPEMPAADFIKALADAGEDGGDPPGCQLCAAWRQSVTAATECSQFLPSWP